jgi:hypothetical protein
MAGHPENGCAVVKAESVEISEEFSIVSVQ